METVRSLPEYVRAAGVGAALGAGASMLSDESSEDGALSLALSYGLLSGAGAFLAPLLTSDVNLQLGATAAVGAGVSYTGLIAGDSLLYAAAIPAASLYVSRAVML